MPLIQTTPRKYEGYFLRDERVSGGGFHECATYTCSHCQGVVMVDPLRTRERAFCQKCNHRLCDRCGVVFAQTLVCKTVTQVIEEMQERAVRSEPQPIVVVSR
jgi:hypothetical protein